MCLCVFYVNIKICIYHIVLKKLNIQQIYLYNINMHFMLGSGKVQISFDNMHTLSITHLVR